MVAEICDTVLVLYAGVTAEYADVDTLFNRPQHPYTRLLLGASPNLNSIGAKLTGIPGPHPAPGQFARGVPLRAALSESFRALSSRGTRTL